MEKPLSYPNQQISIHVPSWGTTESSDTGPLPFKFQSTFPRGERRGGGYAQMSDGISIHVPSWGTTDEVDKYPGSSKFQSTFPRGERRISFEIVHDKIYFNPRSLVGNDKRGGRYIKARTCYFNPRSLVGNDRCFTIASLISFISIHVPSWGTTRTCI